MRAEGPKERIYNFRIYTLNLNRAAERKNCQIWLKAVRQTDVAWQGRGLCLINGTCTLLRPHALLITYTSAMLSIVGERERTACAVSERLLWHGGMSS